MITKVDYVWVRKRWLLFKFHVPDSTTAKTLDLGLYTLRHRTYSFLWDTLLCCMCSKLIVPKGSLCRSVLDYVGLYQ